MVAQTIDLPNIRKFFIPDPGYIMVDADLSGADAQVVAWEADDRDLKDAFRKGLKIHIKNCRDLLPEETAEMTDADLKDTDRPGGLYHNFKRRVHGTNYGASATTLAMKLHTSVELEKRFQTSWFNLHPGIRDWHDRTEHSLFTERKVRNQFGYRIIYFDRVEGLLPKALAWIPQSTVALTCLRGMRRAEQTFSFIEMLLQTHDSATFQVPWRHEDKLSSVVESLHIEIPYEDPLIIPWGITKSRESWGDCE